MGKVGYQRTPNLTGSQADLAVGLNRDFSLSLGGGKALSGFNAGAYYTHTFAVKNEGYYITPDGRDLNADALWFYVKRSW
jgi:hypothetical protein